MSRTPTGAAALNKNPTPAMLAKRIQPGETRNPGGRPKDFEKRVRALVDPDQLIQVAVDIAMGRLPPGLTSESTIRVRDRLAALQFIKESGWGKAKATVEIAQDIAGHALDVDALSDEDFVQLERTMNEMVESQRARRAAPVIDVPVVELETVREPDNG